MEEELKNGVDIWIAKMYSPLQYSKYDPELSCGGIKSFIRFLRQSPLVPIYFIYIDKTIIKSFFFHNNDYFFSIITHLMNGSDTM